VSWLVAKDLQQKIYIMAHFRQGLPKLRDLAAGVENCCVVATAEIAADFGKRKLGEFLGQRHRDLARPGDRTRPLFRVHVGDSNLVVVSNSFLNVLDRDLPVLNREQIA